MLPQRMLPIMPKDQRVFARAFVNLHASNTLCKPRCTCNVVSQGQQTHCKLKFEVEVAATPNLPSVFLEQTPTLTSLSLRIRSTESPWWESAFDPPHFRKLTQRNSARRIGLTTSCPSHARLPAEALLRLYSIIWSLFLASGN